MAIRGGEVIPGGQEREECKSAWSHHAARPACARRRGHRMRRRNLIVSLAGAFVLAPPAARAQRDLPLVAVLVPGTAKLANDRIIAIRKGLQEAGLAEGVNYAFALRY